MGFNKNCKNCGKVLTTATEHYSGFCDDICFRNFNLKNAIKNILKEP